MSREGHPLDPVAAAIRDFEYRWRRINAVYAVLSLALLLIAVLLWLYLSVGDMHLAVAAAAIVPPRRPVCPPAAHARSNARPLEVTLVGELLLDAELRLTAHPAAPRLTVLLAQPGGRVPVLAVEAFGEERAAYHVAKTKARSLRRGVRVELRGEGLSASHLRHVGPVLQLAIVRSVRLLDLPFDAAMAAANDQPTKGDNAQ